MKEIMRKYVEEGRLSERVITKKGVTYSIFCYTKMAFFAFEWDDILISHRGKIYRHEENGDLTPINNPIPKIFNLDEHESSTFDSLERRMETMDYEVLDKVNGHLVIVSPDFQKGNILVSTKGSFEGLAEQDYNFIFMKTGIIDRIRRDTLNYTFMFEALVDYDKHLWYDEQKQRYGGRDNMILLAATDNNTSQELCYQALEQMAWVLGCQVAKRFPVLNGTDVNNWFLHKGIEGYVVHFPEDRSRIKVKTKEYTTLRYIKDITPEKLVNALYNSGWENLYKDYDEELYPILDALKIDVKFYYDNLIFTVDLNQKHYQNRKQIAEDDNLTIHQKSFLFSRLNGVSTEDIICKAIETKSIRELFKKEGLTFFCEKQISLFFSEQKALLDGDVQV